MKRILIVLVKLALLSMTSAIFAYRRGLWIPNYPSEAAFPLRGIDVTHYQGAID